MTREHDFAVREGDMCGAEEAYFKVRPQVDTFDRRRAFCAGYERGWDAGHGHARAALAAQPVQEPVMQRMWVEGSDESNLGWFEVEDVDLSTPLHEGWEPLYAAPVAAQPAQEAPWVSVADQMPDTGRIVLACYVNSNDQIRRVRAKWVAAKTAESGSESDIGEYDEETDCYYDPEGWYECIDNWDDYNAVTISDPVTHWMPLPVPPESSK